MNFKIITLALLATVSAAAIAGDTAEEMLTKINAIATPRFDPSKRGDQAYMQQYYADVNKANAERNVLILEFYKAYPDNPDAEKLLVRRWSTLAQAGKPFDKATVKMIEKDIDTILASHPTAQIQEDGVFWKARYDLEISDNDLRQADRAVDSFTKVYPSDPRGGQLLNMEAQLPAAQNPQARKAIYTRLANDYHDKYASGILRQGDSIGKPFDLSFTDAVSGKQISIADLKGKVVILDFWATWCGPCVAKMPEMKQLYADLHDKGLEVLGISLDFAPAQGGLTKLKDFVAKNDIPWPQYYQGNYWSSEFSTSWGINSIPCVFLIDKNGNLAEVTYPQDLKAKVEKLLAGQ